MNKPTDYPVDTEHKDMFSKTADADITYAQLKNRIEAKQIVTDEMIRIARAKLDAAHTESETAETDIKKSKFKFSSIRDSFRTR